MLVKLYFTIFGNLNERFPFSTKWLPRGGFKTRVLQFKDKNTPLKDKKWKEKVQKNAQFSFCGGRKLFINKSFVEEFNHVFFTGERLVCFEMQPRQ